MTTDTFLFNAGWLFFAAWIAVIGVVTVAAFGRELLPWTSDLKPAHKPHPADRARPTQTATR